MLLVNVDLRNKEFSNGMPIQLVLHVYLYHILYTLNQKIVPVFFFIVFSNPILSVFFFLGSLSCVAFLQFACVWKV